MPDGIAYKYEVVIVEIIHEGLDGRILPLLNGLQFLPGAFEHGIILLLVSSLRFHFEHVAIQLGANFMGYLFCIAAA